MVADGADALISQLRVRPDAVASKRILKAPGFGIVRLAFDAGQSMTDHEAAVPILIQVLTGTVDVEIDGTAQRLQQGGVLYIAARVRHAVNALERADLLLTLADAATRVPSDRAGVGGTDLGRASSAPDHAGTATEPDGGGADRAHAPSPENRPLLAAAVCGCSDAEGAPLPELDVREVPHAIRHATVFGALDSLHPRDGLVLITPHDPLPLLAQISDRTGDRFAVTYLQRGPEAWRLQFVHTGDATAR
jgi:uncharacterized protein (DUF2249 family)/quercetin dioxygenase-like cupin family protein